MPSFPAPNNLVPDLFDLMPAPGTPVTEPEALRILRDLVRPIFALTGTFHEYLRSESDDERYITLSDLTLQYLESAVALLDAWDEHQGPNAVHRRRNAATEEDDDPDDLDADDKPDEPATSPPPSRRRTRRRNPDA